MHANITLPLLIAVSCIVANICWTWSTLTYILFSSITYDGAECGAAQLEADLAAALKRIAELEKEVAALQAQVQTLEQALTAANVQVASLQASIKLP